jgi:hypothetical protein
MPLYHHASPLLSLSFVLRPVFLRLISTRSSDVQQRKPIQIVWLTPRMFGALRLMHLSASPPYAEEESVSSSTYFCLRSCILTRHWLTFDSFLSVYSINSSDGWLLVARSTISNAPELVITFVTTVVRWLLFGQTHPNTPRTLYPPTSSLRALRAYLDLVMVVVMVVVIVAVVAVVVDDAVLMWLACIPSSVECASGFFFPSVAVDLDFVFPL